jgi:HlyD family secretion protein
VIELLVAEGDSVRKGQLLARINPELVVAGLDRSEAALNSAKAQEATSKARLNQLKATYQVNIKPAYERNLKLFQDKVISEAEFQNSKATHDAFLEDLEAARQTLLAAGYAVGSAAAGQKEAREQLQRTNMYAPIDGIVTRLSVAVGERVVGTMQMTGTEMIRIADLGKMEALVEVSEGDVVRIKKGDSVRVEVDAYPGRVFSGWVREVAHSSKAGLAMGATGDQATNFEVRIRLVNESYSDLLVGGRPPLRPGMSTSVEILTNRVENVLSVPITSVTTRMFGADGKVNKRFGDAEGEKEKGETLSDDANKSDMREVVFVYQKGLVKAVEVKTGIQDDRFIQILSGIKSAEEVVTAPFTALSKSLEDGQKVTRVERDQLFSEE